jgi:hypothetical protein
MQIPKKVIVGRRVQGMKKIIGAVSSIVFAVSLLIGAIPAAAVTANVQTPASTPVSTTPSVVITSFGGSPLLDFAELYNQSTTPVALAGVQLQFTVHDDSGGCTDLTYSATLPHGWLLPKSYITLRRAVPPAGDTGGAYFTVPTDFLARCTVPQLAGIQLVDADGSSWQNIAIPEDTLSVSNWAQHKQRTKSSLSITGLFATDYTIQPTASAALYSSPLYQPPADTSGLEIMELLPHATNCSPVDSSLLCGAYVKIFNSSAASIDLSNYRLRTSYGGLKSTAGNTVALSGEIEPGQYALINTKTDGSPLSLTETGGYVWLEDSQGIQEYQPVINYPDASSDSLVGQAWAFDGATWQWTMMPQPTGANYFPPPSPSGITSAASSSSLKPCAANQERSPNTNRCRTISVAVTTPAACQPGQARNPDTGRCKAVVTAKASTPCKAGQERNPATNRCRSIVGATKGSKPCKPGQERNLDTNRCRKVPPKIANVKDIKTVTRTVGHHWYVAAGIITVAAGYVYYEWRQEFADGLENAKLLLRHPRAGFLRQTKDLESVRITDRN